MANIDVVNVVGTIDFHRELDLDALAEAFRQRNEIVDVIYEPTKHHWLQTWFKPNNTYVAFYRRGSCSITGCDSYFAFETVAELVNHVMEEILETHMMSEVKIRNIVGAYDLQSSISLETLSLTLGLESTEYEPEQFPGLIYRQDDHTILVFASGKLICTGLSDLEAVSLAVDGFVAELSQVSIRTKEGP